MKHFVRCITFLLSLFALLSLLGRLWAQPSQATLYAPSIAIEGEEFNVFLDCKLSPADTLNAVLLELPRGLQVVRLVSTDGSKLSLRTASHPVKARTFALALAAERFSSSFLLVLTLRGSDIFAERSELISALLFSLRPREWRLATLDSLEQTALLRTTATLTLQPKPRHDNFSALLDSLEQASLYVPNSRLFALSLQRNFTLECWLRTTALSGVVLSTWSGNPSEAYPIEVEVLSDGRLAAFFGMPFSFVRLTSRRFVADGAWHHLAVTHDSTASLMRLFVDGALQDSVPTRLYRLAFTPALERRTVLYIGSRAGREKFFHGELDELKLYRRAKSAQELAVPEPLERESDAALLWSEPFSPTARSVLIGTGFVTTRASLAPPARIRNLRAEVQQRSVLVSWECSGLPSNAQFTVERSSNGTAFDVAGTLDALPNQTFYRFTDRLPDNAPKVLFYRIRAQSSGRAPLFSQTLKLGLADTKPFRLYQNTPNPFNPTTTIVYELLAPSSVELIIYNMLGNEITRIRRESQPAGVYKYIFNASEFDLSSGIYLYRLQTEMGAETRKMILMK